MKIKHHRHTGGFTLVELLIVIVIIIAVSALGLSMAKRAMLSAKSTQETNNLHQAGLALNVYVAEHSKFPIGWNASSRQSWVDVIIKDQANGELKPTQMAMFWSPLFVKDIPTDLNSEAITHFGANPCIMTDAVDNGTGTMVPKFTITNAQLLRPSEQIILCSAVPKTSNALYHTANPILRDLEPLLGGTSSDGMPPQMKIEAANQEISFPTDIAKKELFGSLPDFYRFGTHKGQFFFADGHIESMPPPSLREKHWATSY